MRETGDVRPPGDTVPHGGAVRQGDAPPGRDSVTQGAGGAARHDDTTPPGGQPPGPASMPIAVDAMGGDHAPAEIVAGAVAAARSSGLRIVLAGHGAIDEIEIVPADETLAMGEGALASWRRPRSSIAVACQLVRRGQAAAVVSAGSTADPKPEMLVQFAQLGVAYAQVGHSISEPRVGLLTIGAEPGKGNKLARRAHELLAADPPHGGLPLSFAGNVEGGDLLTGKVDVIVTDGFTGNVALKTLEGTASFAARQLREALGGSRAARIGTLLQRRGLRFFSDTATTEGYGGAALLGLEGTVVIAHGAVAARGATAAIKLAADLASAGITDKIRERLGPARGGHFLRRP